MVTDGRTKVDGAQCIPYRIDVRYPEAEELVLQAPPNRHTPACLYEAFAPAEAKRLADRLESDNTPKHGRWLNMAEIEWRVPGRLCWDRHVLDRETLR